MDVISKDFHKNFILSMANSFTNFHVDHCGSSMYVHVIKGSKIFFLIPPSKKNLEIYKEWYQTDGKRFFPHLLEVPILF
jgi:F-box/leucine-rich repeat protein 10/11